MREPDWLREHREGREYWNHSPIYTRHYMQNHPPKAAFLRDVSFNNHETNDGTHVSPYDGGRVLVGLDDLQVRLIQGVDEQKFKEVLSRTLRATTGIGYDEPIQPEEWQEMMRGGLQSALETQVVVFEVIGASRALTHQLVRTRRAGFHQQSQRATWYGDKPNVRWPESIVNPDGGRNNESLAVLRAWEDAQEAAWNAYKLACDAGVSYQDARFILPEGTVNYIVCEYSIREFLAVYSYRACSMFMWEMVGAVREMGRMLAEAHPFLAPYIKISCEKGSDCSRCKGTGYLYPDGTAEDTAHLSEPRIEGAHIDCLSCNGIGSLDRRCTFQGWENVEGQCDFPWAKQNNRTFLPDPKFRIGAN